MGIRERQMNLWKKKEVVRMSYFHSWFFKFWDKYTIKKYKYGKNYFSYLIPQVITKQKYDWCSNVTIIGIQALQIKLYM